MTLREQIARVAAELTESVDRQNFAGAANCAGRLGDLVREAARDLPPTESAESVEEGMRALAAARRKACVTRARMAERLRRLQRAASYRAPGCAATRAHTWSVSA